jgi:acyl carrier protein
VIDTSTVDTVTDILVESLELHERRHELTSRTLLFGSMPEFDSLALVIVISAIEERFNFEMDEEDITAEVFESIESLSAYVDHCRT